MRCEQPKTVSNVGTCGTWTTTVPCEACHGCFLDERDRLTKVVKALLASPDGCPFCDSGKLRNPEKPHSDNCPFVLGESAVALW